MKLSIGSAQRDFGASGSGSRLSRLRLRLRLNGFEPKLARFRLRLGVFQPMNIIIYEKFKEFEYLIRV
jgi:hypothetical protein